MNSGYESDDEPMSTDMLEDICGGIQSHPSVNRRYRRCRVMVVTCYCQDVLLC